jgi:poly(hydroxyalkanoate) granule-associated protein
MDKKANNETGHGHSPLYEGVRRMILAGIGALALAQDEVEELIDRLVERGAIAEKERVDLVEEIRTRRKSSREKTRARFNERMEETLERMNVPTKKDINALNDKLTTLTKKVEELRESQSKE